MIELILGFGIIFALVLSQLFSIRREIARGREIEDQELPVSPPDE